MVPTYHEVPLLVMYEYPLSSACTNAHAWLIFFWWRFCMATASDMRSGTGEGRKEGRQAA